LFKLESRTMVSGVFGKPDDPAEFLIDGVYMVTGVGLVVSGILKSGQMSLNDTFMLGPDKNGLYQ